MLNRKGLIGWGAKKLGGAFDAIGGSAFKTGVKEFASKKGILKTLTGVTTKPVGKTLKAFGNLWDDGIRKFANDTVDKFEIDKATNALSNNKTLNSIRENIVNLFKKLFDNKSVRDKAIDALEAAGKEITDESVEEMTKQIADKAANGLIRKIKDKILDGPYLGKILGKLNILSVVTTVADFLIGYKDAESIFGIISESGYVLTPMQRFFAGLANVAAGFLFLFSAEEILNVFIEWVLPLFNINNEDLKIAREKTTKLLTEINATGTDYDVKSYNNRNSIISKAKTAFNNLITSNKDAIAAATSIEGNKTVLDNAAKSINVSTSALTYGTGSGRAYMKDPRYAGLRFNKAGDTQYQTVGDSGCGPAAAVNAVNYAYGTGNDFTSAINMAKEYKEKNGGTHPDFFNKYFKKNGLSSTRLHGTSAIEDNIRKGNPTVLMGKDSKGGYNTPYGPNPHYVTAKGFDSKGNIIIDDPESANGSIAYNKNKVLNHTSVAESIDTKATISSKLSGLKPKRKYLSSNLSTNSVVRKNGRYGRGKYGRGIDTEWVKQTIWNFLRIKGYSEIATAGIMGNIAQECGFDYSLTERGNISNPGVGICQWTWSSRKKAFLAAVPDWTTNLEGQLNFMWNEINTSYKQVLPSNMNQCTDISSAVILFHNVYENSADEYPYTKRQNYAAEIFKQFTGTSAPVDFSSNPSTYDYSSTEYSVTSDTSSASEGIFDKIKNVFFSAFDYTDSQTGEKKNLLSLFGIGGGTSSYSSYSDQSSPISGYTTSISNTPAPKGLSTQQKNVYDLMSRLIGKNEYDQDRRERVDDTLNGASKGYGDCSSTVRYVLKTAAGVDPGSYTGAQITSDKGVYVDGPYEFGQKAMPNANNLAVGDLMFYGKDSSSNPKKVSHVEMYWGDGKRIGHGSGIGPRISDYAAMSSSQQYLGSKRFIPVGATAPSADGLVTTNMDPYRQISVGDTMYGAGSGNTQKPQYGTGASVDYSTLLKVIINILLEIADNSAKVDKIIEFLGNSGIISNDNVEALKAENRFPANKANMANKFKQAYGTGKSNFDDLLARGETSSIIQAMSLIASQ